MSFPTERLSYITARKLMDKCFLRFSPSDYIASLRSIRGDNSSQCYSWKLTKSWELKRLRWRNTTWSQKMALLKVFNCTYPHDNISHSSEGYHLFNWGIHLLHTIQWCSSNIRIHSVLLDVWLTSQNVYVEIMNGIQSTSARSTHATETVQMRVWHGLPEGSLW